MPDPVEDLSANASEDARSAETLLRGDIEAGKVTLPILPAVAMEVLSSSVDDGADAARLAGLIQQDQALATNVLKVVNSPSFRGNTEIVALQQAIARLGMIRIREIALTTSLKNALATKGSYQALMDEAWRHGLATGLWSKEIARATRRNVEQSYLCGLLHNVGNSVVAVDLGARDAGLTLQDAQYVMDCLGRAAGLALVKEWKLPDAVAMVIAYIGDFLAADDEADNVAIVAAGAALAADMASGALSPERITAHPAIQHLNLYPEDAAELIDKVETIEATLESMVL